MDDMSRDELTLQLSDACEEIQDLRASLAAVEEQRERHVLETLKGLSMMAEQFQANWERVCKDRNELKAAWDEVDKNGEALMATSDLQQVPTKTTWDYANRRGFESGHETPLDAVLAAIAVRAGELTW